VLEGSNEAFAIECKFQDSEGTVDEKVPYALGRFARSADEGLHRVRRQGVLAGRSAHAECVSGCGVLVCPVSRQSDSTPDTRELDHLLAMHFRWWDVLVGKKNPVPAAHSARRGSTG
jgi:hypothetical protein